MVAYQAALAAAPLAIGVGRSKPGTIAAAVAAYLVSPQFSGLAEGSRVARRAILQRFRDEHGDKPISSMPTQFIALVLGTKKPHAARNWFKAIRALCQFAVSVEMIAADPTQSIKLPKVKTEHRRPWTDAEIEQYGRTHLIGSKARLALALGLYTIQRLGDVRRMGPQHIRDGEITVRQSKTGTALTLPVLPQLQAIIEATPCEHMTFLVTKSGRPYSSNDPQRTIPRMVQRSWITKGLHLSWIAGDRLHQTGRQWLHHARDRSVVRTHVAEGSREVYQGRQSEAARRQRHGTDREHLTVKFSGPDCQNIALSVACNAKNDPDRFYGFNLSRERRGTPGRL